MIHKIKEKNGNESITYEYDTIEYNYYVTCLEDGYQVKLSIGDAIQGTYKEITNAIEKEVHHLMWSGHPEDPGETWFNEDIDAYITFINAQYPRKVMFLQVTREQVPINDFAGISATLREGSAEYFDRYDSDVSEQFVKICKELNEL